jgi:hypothetical protein
MRRHVHTALVIFAAFAIWTLSEAVYSVTEGQRALIVRLGMPVEVVAEPGLKTKLPFIDSAITFDTRLLLLEPPAVQVILGDQKRLEVETYTRFRIADPLRFYQSLHTVEQARAQLTEILSSSVRRELGQVMLRSLMSDERIRIVAAKGAAARHRGRRSAYPSRRPAVRDEPSHLRPHEVGTSARSQGIASTGFRMGSANPIPSRSRADGHLVGGPARQLIGISAAVSTLGLVGGLSGFR